MMTVTSLNIGETKTIKWRGQEVKTGIYKFPTNSGIHLTKMGVKRDTVVDLKVHGGIDKACYLYSKEHYDYWKGLYPDLTWNWGMFGENITLSYLDENKINIGDIYEIGDAHIQVSQPRQPCFKLGIRFQNQQVLKDFIQSGYSGVYVRVIKEGIVNKGDQAKLIIRSKNSTSVAEVFKMLYAKKINRDLIENIVYDGNLAQSIREQLALKLV